MIALRAPFVNRANVSPSNSNYGPEPSASGSVSESVSAKQRGFAAESHTVPDRPDDAILERHLALN